MKTLHARVAGLIVASIVAAVVSLPVVHAQDDDETVERDEAVARERLLEDVLRLQERQRLLELRQLVQRRVTDFDGTAARLRKHLETRLTGSNT